MMATYKPFNGVSGMLAHSMLMTVAADANTCSAGVQSQQGFADCSRAVCLSQEDLGKY